MNLSFLKYVLRFVLAVAAAWVLLRLLGLAVSYAAGIPLWAMALVIGCGCVLIALLYRRERRIVSAACGRWLVALRCAAFCVAAFILLQPVLQRTVTRRIERTVAVVLDASASMRFNDDGWTPGERLSLARQKGLVDDDVGGRRAAHDDGAEDVDMQAAQRLHALLDVDRPDGGVLALAAHEADACAHGREQEHVHQDDEEDASCEQDEVDHASSP